MTKPFSSGEIWGGLHPCVAEGRHNCYFSATEPPIIKISGEKKKILNALKHKSS